MVLRFKVNWTNHSFSGLTLSARRQALIHRSLYGVSFGNEKYLTPEPFVFDFVLKQPYTEQLLGIVKPLKHLNTCCALHSSCSLRCGRQNTLTRTLVNSVSVLGGVGLGRSYRPLLLPWSRDHSHHRPLLPKLPARTFWKDPGIFPRGGRSNYLLIISRWVKLTKHMSGYLL